MRLIGLVLTLLIGTSAFSQENSPYSRYGAGDLVPNHSISSRAMGGIAAGYSDFQTLNSANPASYGNLSLTTIFDVAAEADVNTLQSISPVKSFTSTNLLFSYVQLGFPIKLKKANKKNIFLGATFGLKPVTRINYDIASTERLNGIDSIQTDYQGNGGITQAYTGLGLRIKDFSIGFNFGYMFGNKNYSTQLSFINDSVTYHPSSTSTSTDFGNVFLAGGLMYQKILAKNSFLKIGVYYNFKQTLNASENVTKETTFYNGSSGETVRLDSVYEKDQKGKIDYPSTLGIGFSLQQEHWLFGADLETSNWKDYRYYGQKDSTQNSWVIRAGAEYFPADLDKLTSLKKYFNFVRYRFGFYYGPDYIKVTNSLPTYAFTFGAGFPLQLRRSYYNTQSSILNTAFEIGSRGDQSSNIRQAVFRLSIGLSLSDIWFRRAKYD